LNQELPRIKTVADPGAAVLKQLSLRHHGLREITSRKLQVLGVLHNFVIKREDGSMAACRFFGQPHRELFPWLVENLPLPSRPRIGRNVSA